MAFIERVGQKRVGFLCCKLFTINYFRCYQVINDFFILLLLFNFLSIRRLIKEKKIFSLKININFFPTDNISVFFAIFETNRNIAFKFF